MIRTLRLENYRSFREHELRDLATVNLLVGPNNCGKTTILEAVHLLVSRGDPRVMTQVAGRRGEVHVRVDDDGYRAIHYHLNHQFHARRLGPANRLSISSDDGIGSVQMEIVEDRGGQTADLFEMDVSTILPLALRIRQGKDREISLPLSEDGSLRWHRQMMRRATHRSSQSLPPSQFVTAESLEAHAMAEIWDQVVINGRESEVIEAMRILQSDLASIHFLTSEPQRRANGLAGIVLGFRDGGSRFPIGSYGDGMRSFLLFPCP